MCNGGAALETRTGSKPLKSGGDNLKITGFDPHPSSDTMLRQKSRRYDGYGSYAPLKMQHVSATPPSNNTSPPHLIELLRYYVITFKSPFLRDNLRPKRQYRYRRYRSNFRL
jgi:hypothetical protein